MADIGATSLFSPLVFILLVWRFYFLRFQALLAQLFIRW